MSASKDVIARSDQAAGVSEAPRPITQVQNGFSIRQQALANAVAWGSATNENYPSVVAAAKSFEAYLTGEDKSKP